MHLPKDGCELSREESRKSVRPLPEQPRAGGAGRDAIHPPAVAPAQVTCGLGPFSCHSFSPFPLSLKAVRQLCSRPLVSMPSPHPVSAAFPRWRAPSPCCQRLLAACRPLRFPESKGCQVPSPVDCSKVWTAVMWLLFLRNDFLESTHTAWAAGTWSSLG